MESGNGKVVVSSSNVYFELDKATGMVTSYKVNGTEFFDKAFGVQPNFCARPMITIMATVIPSVCRYGKSRVVTSR